MTLRPLLWLFPLFVFATSCKETYSDIGHEPEMKSRIDAMIEEMARVSESFPMDPPPISSAPEEELRFLGWDTQNSNSLLIDTYQLAFFDSNVGFNDEHFVEIGPRYHLVKTLQSRHSSQKEAPEGFREELEEILGLRFIVAVFVIYDEPVIDVDLRSFTGGSIAAIVAVYDRKKSAWLGGFKTKANPPQKVDFKTNAEWKYRRDGNYYLRSRTEGALENQIEDILSPYIEKSMSAPVESAPGESVDSVSDEE